MANSTLAAIRSKVRRLTRSPSDSQITTAQIDEYVNTFLLYDFPEALRLFSLRTNLTFYTQPNVGTYVNNTTNPLDSLYNFKNRYVALHPPCYIAGVQAYFTQDRASFYAQWPKVSNISDTQLRGNGMAGPYTGTLTGFPVLQNNVMFTATDVNGTAMVLVDYPSTNVLGALGIPNQSQTIPSVYGQINYATGAFTATFPSLVPLNTVIYSETVPYAVGKPVSILYYDNSFVIRPVPDKAYEVTVEADARPTELLSSAAIPYEEQWWQYVSLGAAIKIFQDRMDIDSVNLLFPEFQRQEDFVGRTSLTQYANERTKTIYTQGKNYGAGWFLTQWPY